MPDGVYNSDELVYTALTEKERKKKKELRSKYIKSWIGLITVCSLALLILLWHYKNLTSSSESSSNGCPHGYQYFGKTGACYKFTVLATSFEEAKRSCEFDGTQLVSIYSKEENDHLSSKYSEKVEEFQRNIGTTQDRSTFWIGLSLEDGEWQWSDGSDVNYENWMHGKPGNQSQAVVETDSKQYSWMTVSREYMQGFICKKQLRFSKKRRDLSSVQEAPSTTTAEPKKSEMEEGLGMAMKVMGEFFKGVGSIAKAASEAEASRRIPSSTVSSPVAPESDSLPNDIKCSPGYTFCKETGFCYKVDMKELKFNDATRACLSDQAQLASIHSATENDFLNMLYLHKYRDYIQNIDIHMDKSDLWIGLIYKSGKWEWTDGTPVDYVNWAIEEPNNLQFFGRYVEHWVTMRTRRREDWSPKGNEWNNCVGSDKFAYICKKPPIPKTTTTQIPVTTPLIVDNGNECPSGYRHFESFCYKVTIPAVTFEEAQKSCESEDTHLASIHSAAENRFIPALYNETLAEYRRKIDIMQEKTSIWIGFHYEHDEWKWTDGSEVDYKNWAPTEPNLMEKEEFNTIMVLSKIPDYSPNGDKWNNVSKDSTHGFVCKRKATSEDQEGSGESE